MVWGKPILRKNDRVFGILLFGFIKKRNTKTYGYGLYLFKN